MGYRHYLHAVDKNLIEKIQKCTTNEKWCNLVTSLGYEVDYEATGDGTGYFPPHSIGTEIYGLGKYSEIGSWLENNDLPLDGIFANNPDRIFEAGVSTKETEEDGKGSGIGLWITKTLVLDNSGEIHPMVKSDGFGLKISLPK